MPEPLNQCDTSA